SNLPKTQGSLSFALEKPWHENCFLSAHERDEGGLVKVIILSMMVVMMSWTSAAWSTELKNPAGQEVIDCSHLQEKIKIFMPLQETITQEFARLSDKALC